jgi:hypothetical protein
MEEIKEDCGIKIGEYIRTKDGLIGKLEQLNYEPTNKNVIYIITDNFEGFFEEIISRSFNIIDLIEERRLFRWCKS